jgi:flap endonuclease-1
LITIGVKLRTIVSKRPVQLESLRGKSIAIDAHNALYQFLSIIRQPNGALLKDRSGRITSHLSGLLYRNSNLIEKGIKPIYVFDGKPPYLKKTEILRRKKIRTKARIKYKDALEKGDIKRAKTYAQATSKLEDYMIDDSKILLTLMGVPWVQAPSEGEAQAAHITRSGNSDYCGSQDYDSLLFGAPRLIRNMTITGKRKLPGKKAYVEVIPEIIELGKLLGKLEITREQLVDIGILLGTDFNPEGFKGIGPKRALKLIRKFGSFEKISKSMDLESSFDVQQIREIFLNPKVNDEYQIKWETPDIEGTLKLLCEQRSFSENRVKKALSRFTEGLSEIKRNVTLETFF